MSLMVSADGVFLPEGPKLFTRQVRAFQKEMQMATVVPNAQLSKPFEIKKEVLQSHPGEKKGTADHNRGDA